MLKKYKYCKLCFLKVFSNVAHSIEVLCPNIIPLSIMHPAHILKNAHPLFLSWELLKFFPSPSDLPKSELRHSFSLIPSPSLCESLSESGFCCCLPHISASTVIYKPSPRLPSRPQSLYGNSALCSSHLCSESPPHGTVVCFVPV